MVLIPAKVRDTGDITALKLTQAHVQESTLCSLPADKAVRSAKPTTQLQLDLRFKMYGYTPSYDWATHRILSIATVVMGMIYCSAG
jgi:hypothetical protein